jgi:hypothetical protein
MQVIALWKAKPRRCIIISRKPIVLFRSQKGLWRRIVVLRCISYSRICNTPFTHSELVHVPLVMVICIPIYTAPGTNSRVRISVVLKGCSWDKTRAWLWESSSGYVASHPRIAGLIPADHIHKRSLRFYADVSPSKKLIHFVTIGSSEKVITDRPLGPLRPWFP